MKRLAVLALVLWPGAALAHAGPELGEHAEWTLDPGLTVPLALSALIYALGWSRLRRRSGQGRPGLDRQAALFAAGWLVLAGALVSPLHEAGERSFTAHMLEHELLMLAAAPLLVLARPFATMLWAFPAGGRQALGRLGRTLQPPFRVLTEPVTATLIQAAALWLWHAPTLFDLALQSEPVHVLQHASFLLSALFFWSAMLHPRLGRRALGVAAVCLFATSIVGGALGALMALSQSPWYAPYAALGLTAFGLTPTEDQQLAGLLMWIPGGMVHAGAALALVGRAVMRQEASDAAAAR